MTNEELQRAGKPYYRVTDLTPEQFAQYMQRAIYRGGSIAVLIGLIGFAALGALVFAALAVIR